MFYCQNLKAYLCTAMSRKKVVEKSATFAKYSLSSCIIKLNMDCNVVLGSRKRQTARKIRARQTANKYYFEFCQI